MTPDKFRFDLQQFAEDDKKTDDSTSDDSKKTTDKKTDDDGRKSYDENYVSGLREENKKRRLREEALQTERDDLAKKVSDREKKDLEADGKLQELLETERKERKTLEDGYKEKLTASDRRFILAEAKALAIKEGIVNPDDVKLGLDVNDLRIDDDGDVPGLAEKIAALKESKSHWFKSDDKKTDADPKKKPAVVTPTKKTDDGTATKDHMKDDAASFSATLKSFGVTGY